MGLVAGIALIIVGAATMIFGSNEIATVITGNNYIQQKTGMSDFEYGLVYNGLNLASSIGQILGDCYFLHKTRTVRIGKNNEIDGYRYYDIAGEPLFDFDYAHGGNVTLYITNPNNISVTADILVKDCYSSDTKNDTVTLSPNENRTYHVGEMYTTKVEATVTLRRGGYTTMTNSEILQGSFGSSGGSSGSTSSGQS